MMSQLGGMGLPGVRRRSATKSAKNVRKGKKGKAKGRGPTQPRLPAGFPPGAFNPGAFNPGALPPGMELPDLSKLDLPDR
jgi:signal recognition particle subunit SRP54